MGCTGSKTTAAVAKQPPPSNDYAEDYAAERRKRLEEEERQRIEEEREIAEKLYAEKEGLRIRSHFMIEQKSSCDNLLELLEKQDLDHIRENETSLLVQKSAKLKVELTNPDRIKRDWIVSAFVRLVALTLYTHCRFLLIFTERCPLSMFLLVFVLLRVCVNHLHLYIHLIPCVSQ